MAEMIHITYNDKPSALYTLWKAFRSRNSKFTGKDSIPVIHIHRSAFHIDPKHIKDFHEICRISPTEYLHILYPLTLAYPYIMLILCKKDIPISLFKILNTRGSITLHRRIRPDEIMEINCRNSPVRIIPKGLEIDIVSEMTTGGERVWSNTTTYFYRGRFGESNGANQQPLLERINSAPVVHEWFLPAKDRFRFARVSGDTNGIHYGSFYARLFGFKRDFAQPIRVVAQCVSHLPGDSAEIPARLDFFLKGPVYYESTLRLTNVRNGNKNRFDLYCEGNDKACISGELRNITV
ncbi:MAG: hypothetical protein A2176_00095 [Spirochaetes bacterium RBG_13_51_14]|nr:MAG: hypothetical protein A2176_00095 [Spirochaetes bacterium RBG_13_51_14]